MPQYFIRIISRPDGGAPVEIRDKWIGVRLPVEYQSDEPLADVITHQRVARVGGHAVRWDEAMDRLGESHPDARRWWETNVAQWNTLIFDRDCCEVLPD